MSVKQSRRGFIKHSAAAVALSRLDSTDTTTEIECGSSSLSTPQSPETSLDAVISEAYGELALCPQRRYWRWEVESYDPFTLDYEVRVPEDTAYPDVLVVDQDGWDTYEQIVTDYSVFDGPVVEWQTKEYRWVGEQTVPQVNGENFNPKNIGAKIGSFRDEQLWKEQSHGQESSPIFEIDTVDCLSNPASRPIRESESIAGGQYYVVFDWTEEVLSKPDPEGVSAEVAVRATTPISESQGETEYENEVTQLYNSLPDEEGPLVQSARQFAEAICDTAEAVSLDDVQTAVPEASQTASMVNMLLTVIEDQLGYAPTFRSEVMAGASSWARLGMSVLPVLSSAEQLVDDACAVARAKPSSVTGEVENLLASLGIFVADLLLVKFGGASKAARVVTGAAHKYLLGYLRQVLGLRAYAILLRELYTLITSSIAQALERVREITRQLASETEFLDDDDVEWIEERDEDDLGSLRPKFTMRSPECQL